MAWHAGMIVKVATSKEGSEDWLQNKAKDDFAEKTVKCNKFVYDVMVEARVTPPPEVRAGFKFWKKRAPTAGEWADAGKEIDGWVVVADPQPGDVVAEAHQYSNATGHCGIVVGDKQTASASAPEGGKIVINDWGFRADNKPTFRRCILAAAPAPAPGVTPPSPPPPR